MIAKNVRIFNLCVIKEGIFLSCLNQDNFKIINPHLFHEKTKGTPKFYLNNPTDGIF